MSQLSVSSNWSRKIDSVPASDFSKRVWKAMLHVPKGKVATYASVARAIGSPNAMRAVGSACGANPFAPQVPCHRIVASDGKIGGYSGSGGLETKIRLLKSEGVRIVQNKIVDFDSIQILF